LTAAGGSGEPLVSVVLPFRDAAATLGAALDSIAAQTLTRLECVLVDHLSADGSSALAADYARRDRRFRVVPCAGSFVDALNLGVAAARAPLIARMDADDIAHRQRLDQQVAALAADARLQLVSCLVECFPRAALRGGMLRYEAWVNGVVSAEQIRAALFVESPLPHPSVVFRRAAFDAAGGYAETGGPEDYDLWLRMILGGARATKIPRYLLRWRDSPRRLSRVDARYAKQRFFAAKLRHFPVLLPPPTPLQLWGSGPTARRWARHLRASGYEIRRFVDIAKARVGRTVQGLTVEAPAALRREDGVVLAAVGLPGARELIETELRRRGFAPLRDYVAVA
jgi:glycosyltransferase involved in cell wall biosynthesis